MCRLLYVNTKQEVPMLNYLSKFAEIARQSREYQGHGWGLAFQSNGKWQNYKNISPIWEDDLSQFGKSNRLVAHARSAFKDERIAIENNMPFYDDKYIFIFNGELRGVKIKQNGRIGAEKIFNFIKRFDKQGINVAINKGTQIISEKSSYVKAMNIIIVDETASYVYSQFSEDEEYFTMHRKVIDNSIVICSREFANETGWEPITNNSLTEYKCL